MSQDRAHSARFRVTQEFLAYMLGVRRVSVTAAAGGLQQGGLIEYRRGDLTVLDRAGLEAAACGCYAADRQAYDNLL
jgi:Mn-dependent DtxR family transcriptional regulator